MRFWIGVVSRSHALKGIKEGFTQVCHGKKSPLARMKRNDWFIFYSPKMEFEGKDPCQKFVGIGQVKTGDVYEFDMGGGFKPFRIDIEYKDCIETSIHPLIEKLSFIRNKKSWGMAFRFGHIEIPQEDFLLIAESMKVDLEKINIVSEKIKKKGSTHNQNTLFAEKAISKKRTLEDSSVETLVIDKQPPTKKFKR